MYKRYINELNKEEYRITIKEFKSWLKENDLLEKFLQEATEDIIKTAIDFSVMIVTVKAIIIQK